MARQCLFSRYQRFTNNTCTSSNPTTFRNTVTTSTLQAEYANNSCIKRNHFRSVLNYQSIQRYSTSSLNEKNIFKSTVRDVQNYRGILVHEFIWKNIDKWANKTALVCSMTGKSYTYEQLRKLSGRFATSLRKNNLRPGDTVAAILPNVPEYAIVLMGASEAGVKVTLVNPIYTLDEMKRQLIHSDTAAVVTIPLLYPIIAQALADNVAIRLPPIVIDGYGPVPPGTINMMDLISDSVEEFEKTGEKAHQDPESDTFLIPYSSGTTGPPKGVELTHGNLVANCTQSIVKELLLSREAIGNHQEIVPLILPVFHTYGFHILGCSLRMGGKLICVPIFSSTALLELFEAHRATDFFVVPPMIQLIANDERFTPRHMESLQCITCGAAPMSQEVIEKLLRRCGSHLNFTQGYGLTETSPSISRSTKAPLDSSGLLIPDTEIKIIAYEGENEGQSLGSNEIGEIYVRGPQVMKGYYKNPQATQECMTEGWLKTGDLGCIDDEGFIYLRGRLKELIKVQGYQVAPAELEDILQSHEKVADAAVIGIPHEKYGEIPKAFIVPMPDMKIDEQDIKNYVARRVTKYKQLGHVVTIDQIPKSPAGKILRRELQKM